MKKIFQILIIVCSGLLLNSCYYDAYPEYDVIDEIPDTQIVSFKDDIQPIIAFCAGCHNGSLNPDLTEGNAYNSLVSSFITANNADGSKLFDFMPGFGEHPDTGKTLSADELALLREWINQGALNN